MVITFVTNITLSVWRNVIFIEYFISITHGVNKIPDTGM